MPTIVGIVTFMSMKNSILVLSEPKTAEFLDVFILLSFKISFSAAFSMTKYEGISKGFEPNMERARNLDLFCFIFQRSPLPTPHTCPI